MTSVVTNLPTHHLDDSPKRFIPSGARAAG